MNAKKSKGLLAHKGGQQQVRSAASLKWTGRRMHATSAKTDNRLVPFAVFAVLTLALATVPAVAAEDDPMPQPFMGDISAGMVDVAGSGMEQRPHASYVVLDAQAERVDLQAADYQTPFLDLVALNLAPGHLYRLELTESHTPADMACDALGAVSFGEGDGLCGDAADAAFRRLMATPTQDPAGPDGKAVLWNVPLWPSTYNLVDTTTGETAMVVNIEEPSPPAEVTGSMAATVWCCKSGYSYTPPKPTNLQQGPGETTVQGAYSFTYDATVKTTTCWGHSVKVDAYVTGGKAAASGTAGGTKTTSRAYCTTIEDPGAPTNAGLRLRYADTYQKDSYSDGSYKVYPKSWGYATIYGEHYVNWSPSGSPHYTTTTAPLTITVTENHAGGVYLAGKTGGEAFGVGMGVTLSADNSRESMIQVRIQAPDASSHRYQWKFVNGDASQTGIYGMVWKNY